MVLATKATPEEIAKSRMSRGDYPPLEDILKAFRRRYVEDNEIPGAEDGNFEAPDSFPWGALADFVQRKTGKDVKYLMENTLAGFPHPFTIKTAQSIFLQKFHSDTYGVNGNTDAPDGLPWMVLNVVLDEIEHSISGKKASKPKKEKNKKEKAPESESEDAKESAPVTSLYTPSVASLKTPMHEVNMTPNVRNALEQYKMLADEAFAIETEKNDQATLVRRRAEETLKRLSVPSQSADLSRLVIADNALYSIEECAEAVRNFVRKYKKTPSSSKNDVMTLPTGIETTSKDIHFALSEEMVSGGNNIHSLAQLNRAIGFLQIGLYDPKILNGETFDARLIFNDIIHYYALFDQLPDNEASGRFAKLSDKGSIKAVSLAFQTGNVTGWEEFAKSRNIPGHIPVPLNMNDFMVVCGIAERTNRYGIRLAQNPENPVLDPVKSTGRPPAVMRTSIKKPAVFASEPRPVISASPVGSVLVPAQKPQPFVPSLRPASSDKFTLLDAANALRAHMRKHRTLSNLHKPEKIKLEITGKPAISYESFNSAFVRKRVTNARDFANAADVRERIGFLAEGHYAKDVLEGKKFNARDIFNDVAGYVATHDLLPTHDRTGKKEYVGEHRIKILTLAFQKGVVEGWDDLTSEIGLNTTPVPTCFYDFLAVTGFAYRDRDYMLQSVQSPPGKLASIPVKTAAEAETPATLEV